MIDKIDVLQAILSVEIKKAKQGYLAKYKHDCEYCRLIYQTDKYDCYVCKNTIVLRYDNDGPDYVSYSFAVCRNNGKLPKSEELSIAFKTYLIDVCLTDMNDVSVRK